MSYTFKNKSVNPHFTNVADVAPQEVFEHIPELTLIDVRENSEYVGELGHIKGTQLIVLSTIPQNLSSIPREKPIVFVCRSGARSAQAANFAKQQGFDAVYNMTGGMLLWNQMQLPTEK